jgi:hypothetical protein
MSPEAELAELVMDHLGRTGGVAAATAALASVIVGLASILAAYDDAQERRGNWGAMLAHLREGFRHIEPALPVLRRHGGPDVQAVVERAERELPFAALLQDEIVRLQAAESTNA